MNFEKAFEKLLGHEGGFVDHPRDPGGATRYGITQRVARAHGYQGEMRELPVAEARRIARIAYWDAVRADEVPDAVRYDLFDAAYHSGPEQATKWLQRAAGADDDGKLGPKTLLAVRMADPQLLAKRFNGHRLWFLADLKTWDAFGKGWARRVAANLLGA
ncbi:MAG: glycoside hydrolase family 108 protein [Thauera sp.]